MNRIDPQAFVGKCELCGKQDELRPYGRNNESICADCGMKDLPTTNRKIREMFDRAD